MDREHSNLVPKTQRIAKRAASRLLLFNVLNQFGVWIPRWMLMIAIMVVIGRLLSWRFVGDSWWILFGAGVLISLLIASIEGVLTKLDRVQAAGVLDDLLESNAQFRSAIELGNDPDLNPESEGFVELAQRAAEDQAQQVRVDQVINDWSLDRFWFSGACVLLVIGLGIWFPMRSSDVRSADDQFASVLPEETIATIDQALETIDDSESESLEVQEKIKEIEQLRDELSEGVIDQEEANAKASSQLDELADTLEDHAQELSAKDQETFEDLAQLEQEWAEDSFDEDFDPFQEPIKEPVDDQLKEILDSLSEQEYESVEEQLDELDKQLEKLDDAQREDAIDRLKELANQLENSENQNPNSDEPEPESDSEQESETRENQDSSQDDQDQSTPDETSSGDRSENQEDQKSEEDSSRESGAQDSTQQSDDASKEEESRSSDDQSDQESNQRNEEDKDQKGESQEQSNRKSEDQNGDQSDSGESSQEQESGKQDSDNREPDEQGSEQQDSENPGSDAREQFDQQDPQPGGEEEGVGAQEDQTQDQESDQIGSEGDDQGSASDRVREQVEKLKERREQRRKSSEAADELREQSRELLKHDTGPEDPQGQEGVVGRPDESGDGIGPSSDDQSETDDPGINRQEDVQYDPVQVPQGDQGKDESGRVIDDEWYSSEQGQNQSANESFQSDEDVQGAWDRAERAMEEREVPRKYHRLIRRAFERARERAKEQPTRHAPLGKDAQPSAQKKEGGSSTDSQSGDSD